MVAWVGTSIVMCYDYVKVIYCSHYVYDVMFCLI